MTSLSPPRSRLPRSAIWRGGVLGLLGLALLAGCGRKGNPEPPPEPKAPAATPAPSGGAPIPSTTVP